MQANLDLNCSHMALWATSTSCTTCYLLQTLWWIDLSPCLVNFIRELWELSLTSGSVRGLQSEQKLCVNKVLNFLFFTIISHPFAYYQQHLSYALCRQYSSRSACTSTLTWKFDCLLITQCNSVLKICWHCSSQIRLCGWLIAITVCIWHIIHHAKS